jgi:hypothetical protein
VLTRLATVEGYIDERIPQVRGLWLVGGTRSTFHTAVGAHSTGSRCRTATASC